MRTQLAALASAATALVLAAQPVNASAPGVPHLPDLITEKPSQLKLDTWWDGRTLLRLSNTVSNGGDGPLEVSPTQLPDGGTTLASQRIYTHDAGGAFRPMFDRPAGTFSYHAQHGHWHFEDFALYELLATRADGSPGEVIRSSGKVTFCIVDVYKTGAALEHAAKQRHYGYDRCDSRGTQGMSVGWGDQYPYWLYDQTIDVTGVPDGHYWLRSTADPEDRLLEEDEANNAAIVRVVINGGNVHSPS